MATINPFFLQKSAGSKIENMPLGWKAFTIKLADLNAAKGSATASGDKVVLHVTKAGERVSETVLNVETAVAGGSVSCATAKLGDEDVSDAFWGATLVTSTGITADSSDKIFSAAKNIVLELGGTWTGATAGEIKVFLKLENFA